MGSKKFDEMDQAEREHLMRDLAGAIDIALESECGKVCFTLIVWPEDKDVLSNYISNAVRSDVIKALRETADRLEAKQDMGPVVGKMQ